VVYNADIISDIDLNILIEYHSSRKNWATLALVKNKETDGVLIDEESNIIEFNSQSKIGYTFSGISVISKEIYEQLPEKIYFNIIDLYKEIIKSDNNKKIKGFFLGDNLWSDIGSPESYWNLVCRIFSDNNLLGKFNISKFGNENLEIFKNQKSIFIDSEIKKEIINSIIFQNKKVL
nr:hypothetical protein [Candidatus Dependentiae bacterium]